MTMNITKLLIFIIKLMGCPDISIGKTLANKCKSAVRHLPIFPQEHCYSYDLCTNNVDCVILIKVISMSLRVYLTFNFPFFIAYFYTYFQVLNMLQIFK